MAMKPIDKTKLTAPPDLSVSDTSRPAGSDFVSYLYQAINDSPKTSTYIGQPASSWFSRNGNCANNKNYPKHFFSLEDRLLFEDTSGQLLVIAGAAENGKDDSKTIRFWNPAYDYPFIRLAISSTGNLEINNIAGTKYDSNKKAAQILSSFRTNPLIDRVYREMGLPELGHADLAEQAQKQALIGRTLQIANRTQATYREQLMFQQSNVITVGQKEMAASKYGAEDSSLPRYLQTFGAGPCIVCTVYKDGKGGMVHADSLTEIRSSLTQLFQVMNLKPSEVEVRLIGGQDIQDVSKLLGSLEQLGIKDEQIKEIDMNCSGQESKKVILDLKDGKVYDMSGTPAMDEGHASRMMMNVLFSRSSSTPAKLLSQGLAESSYQRPIPGREKLYFDVDNI